MGSAYERTWLLTRARVVGGVALSSDLDHFVGLEFPTAFRALPGAESKIVPTPTAKAVVHATHLFPVSPPGDDKTTDRLNGKKDDAYNEERGEAVRYSPCQPIRTYAAEYERHRRHNREKAPKHRVDSNASMCHNTYENVMHPLPSRRSRHRCRLCPQ